MRWAVLPRHLCLGLVWPAGRRWAPAPIGTSRSLPGFLWFGRAGAPLRALPAGGAAGAASRAGVSRAGRSRAGEEVPASGLVRRWRGSPAHCYSCVQPFVTLPLSKWS